ncbi:MAG: 4Fe-4S binding protein [Pseudomonadota bacterium]|nr:4Fe-4S binding protein [Pseudomonadota bacterium]
MLACCWGAHAGVMTKASMLAAFPSPLIVGEKESDLPVWPVFKQDGTSTPLIGYVFESIDLAPIPGFSGTPFNLLIALDAKGEFISVRVLSQHEPVFLDGLGPEPMLRFVEQYKGLSLKQNIKIGAEKNNAGSANVFIHGVAKATASVRILNQSLLSASLKVARARLGYAQGRDPDLIARIKPGLYQPMDWAGLIKAGLVNKKIISNRDIEAAFAGTVVAGLDRQAAQLPEASFMELYVAHLEVPSVGRNLLSPKDWDYLQGRLEPGDSALLVLGTGRYSLLGDDFVRGAVPSRITLRQGSLPLEMRDLDLDTALKLPPPLQSAEWKVFRVIAPSGLDPSQPLAFDLRVTRSKGLMYPEQVGKDFTLVSQLPEEYFDAARADNKTWHSIWHDRAPELALLGLGLVVLAWALRRQAWLSADLRRLRTFRTGYLLFTLLFIGWYAQGQLSIVNLTALIQALVAGRSLVFFLYDPMTVVLWLFVIVTFFVWGRGTFCGWLCPFGALQELLSQLARLLKVPQVRLGTRADARLKLVKYAVLAGVLVTAALSVPWTDRLVEVEPFKTSITLLFVRAWPFVLWAVGLLLLSTVVYKGFCRYLCPLGAGMALLGRLRLLDWLPRRAECGKPCQRCQHDCRYQAIQKTGEIDYQECFQCLDCVAIEQSDALCVPLIMQKRRANTVIAIHPVAAPVQAAPLAGARP